MKLEAQVRYNLNKAIVKGMDVVPWIRDTSAVVEREYKQQVPVDDGKMRQGVTTRDEAGGYVVTTNATNNGFPYPIAVHEGRGVYEGGTDRGKGNWTRQANYTEEDIILFKVLAKQGYVFDVQPNKFADRTRENTNEEILKNLFNRINRELHKN